MALGLVFSSSKLHDKMTDCTISNSEIFDLNDSPKDNELGSKSHMKNSENSFDEVFSLLESTLVDLMENDMSVGLDSIDVEVDSNNSVGMCELGISKEILSLDSNLNNEVGLERDCKFDRADDHSMENSLQMFDHNVTNHNCRCSCIQSEKYDGMKCSCRVLSEDCGDSAHIQMSTKIDFKHKIPESVICKHQEDCSCSSLVKAQHLSHVESNIGTSGELQQSYPFVLKLDSGSSTYLENTFNGGELEKEAAAKTPDAVCKGNCNGKRLTIGVNSPQKQNIDESNVLLNEVITEIDNEDELLGNEEENVNIKDIGIGCIELENNISLEEELLSDEKDREIVLNQNILIEKHTSHTEIFLENISKEASRPVKPVNMPPEDERELKSKIEVYSIESPSSIPLNDKKLKSKNVQNLLALEINSDHLNLTDGLENDAPKQLYCSTPNVSDNCDKALSGSLKNRDFGSMSPLTTRAEEATYLKRKAGNLVTIKEENEEIDSSCTKRMKLEKSSLTLENSRRNSPRKTLEAPAVSLLKKWRPSCLSRNSFYIIDETVDETENGDDYEDVIKSLSETLTKGSTAQEAYQKHVLDQNCRDNLKFTEVMQELTQELQIEFEEEDRFLEDINEDTVTENTVDETNNTVTATDLKEHSTLKLQPKENFNQSVSCQILVERQDDNNRNKLSAVPSEDLEVDSNLSIIYSNDKDKNDDDDEEDILLKEGEFDDKLKKKPRDLEFFISNDPLENEDNTDKEWDLLRKLSTDEERYKVVRERWRSLTIPDPKKDLTYRQWRTRNNLHPLTQIKAKTKNRKEGDEPATRMCTVLFDQNIDQILRHLEFKRREVRLSLGRELERLGFQQEQEQKQLFMNGGSVRQIYNLHCHHIGEVGNMKERFETLFQNEERVSRERISALKEASDEVLTFEKYYQGLDRDRTEGNKNNILLTDTEIEELVQTECMLEQYERYYDER